IRPRGRVAGVSAREIEARMEEIGDFSGLGAFLAMPVKTYSAGMQARLAFAAATAVEADVLLMDEWIAVGDADFQKLAHKRLLKLVERAGILVLASHDVELLRLYCNKVMRLEGAVATAVKPYVFKRFLAEKGVGSATYLDPDIMVFRPMGRVRQGLERAQLVLTPHLTRPLLGAALPNDHAILRSGSFNLGFCAARAED